MFNNATLNIWILKKKKLTVARMFNQKAMSGLAKVTYHLRRISEKGFERFKEKYIGIQIHHPLLMQPDIFGY